MQEYSKHIVWFTFIVMILYVISLFLPSNVKVSHTEVIYGETAEVFEQLNDLSNWKNWCVWSNENQKSFIIYSENTIGKGAYFKWKHGKKYNSDGMIELVHTHKNKSIEFYIKASSIDSIFSFVYLHPTSEGVEVEWVSDLELNNSGSRLMGYFLKNWLLRDIKKSLKNINRYLIENNKHIGWMSKDVTLEEIKNFHAMTLQDTLDNTAFEEHLNNNWNLLSQMAHEKIKDEAELYFYRKIASLSSQKSVYLFGIKIKSKNIEDPSLVSMSGKYLQVRYFGSAKGVKNTLSKSKKMASIAKVRIDNNPYVFYKKYPIDFSQMDTTLMYLGFPIH